MTYLKTILQVSSRCFTRPLFWEENWLWNLGSRHCFAELAKTVVQYPAFVKPSFLGKPLDYLGTAVQLFPIVANYRPLYCRCMAVHLFVLWRAWWWRYTVAGKEPAPRMPEGEDCTPSYFFCAWVFVPFAPWLGFIGKRSVRSRLCCLFCFSANWKIQPCLAAACQGPNLMVSVLI